MRRGYLHQTTRKLDIRHGGTPHYIVDTPVRGMVVRARQRPIVEGIDAGTEASRTGKDEGSEGRPLSQRDERTADPRAQAFTHEETYAATRRPVSLAETLLPDAYTSEAFFALERERVFASAWVAVGCSARLRQPGDVLVADVAGR